MLKISRHFYLALYIIICSLLPIAFGVGAASVPLIGLTLILFTRPPFSIIAFAFILGAILESISPFPPLAYLGAMLATFFLLRLITRYYLSNRTVFSAAITGLAAVIFFELLIFIFARALQAASFSGWIPVLDRSYLHFIFWRVLANSAIVAIGFFILQRISPKTRGTIIEQHSFYR